MLTARGLTRELHGISDGQQCLELLSESRRVLGFDIVGFRDSVEAPVAPRLADARHWAERFGWPDDFMGGWIEGGLARHFPRSCTARRPDGVRVWELPNLNDPAAITILSPNQLAAVRHLRRFGIHRGITVPVRRPFGQIGCLSWMMPHDGRPMSGDRIETMRRFSREFFETLDHCGAWRASAPLSSRALECLQLAACGLSDKQIAEYIHRSVETVRFHMKAAIRQLDAVNRTHAVALAVRAGLIGPLDVRRALRVPSR